MLLNVLPVNLQKQTAIKHITFYLFCNLHLPPRIYICGLIGVNVNEYFMKYYNHFRIIRDIHTETSLSLCI